DVEKVLYDQSSCIAGCADAGIERNQRAFSRPRRELDGVPVGGAPDDVSCLAFDPETVAQLGQPAEVHLSVRLPVRERELRDRFATAQRIISVGRNLRLTAQPPADQIEHVWPHVEQDPLPGPT